MRIAAQSLLKNSQIFSHKILNENEMKPFLSSPLDP